MPDRQTGYARFLDPEGTESWGIVNGNSLKRLDHSPLNEHHETGDEYSVDDVTLLAPCEPTKIVAVGLNYRDHAKELNMVLPDEPVIFLKPPTALAASGQVIAIPRSSKQVDYEAELAIVIGKTARHVDEEHVDNYILGYTCANDLTARDLQKKDGQWTRAKSFDMFCPAGPYLSTARPSADAKIVLKKNGEIKQDSSIDQMIFGIGTIVSFISRIMTLQPGDLILTGTPPGIGPVNDNDEVAIEIEGLGTLTNKFALEK